MDLHLDLHILGYVYTDIGWWLEIMMKTLFQWFDRQLKNLPIYIYLTAEMSSGYGNDYYKRNMKQTIVISGIHELTYRVIYISKIWQHRKCYSKSYIHTGQNVKTNPKIFFKYTKIKRKTYGFPSKMHLDGDKVSVVPTYLIWIAKFF